MANDPESQFVIPEAAFTSIRQLVDMRSDDFDAFILALAAAKPSPTSAGLACSISKQAPNVSESVISSIVDEILTLESVKNDTDLSVEDFIQNIIHAAIEAKSDKFPFAESDADCLKVRLERIFASDHALALLISFNGGNPHFRLRSPVTIGPLMRPRRHLLIAMLKLMNSVGFRFAIIQ